MEKLELKHIVGYLPYGLKVQLLDREVFTRRIVVGCTNKGILRIGDDGHHNWEECFDKIQPILRPLSDLTKEIEVNGKSFVPAEYFWSVDYHEQQLFELYGTLPFYWKACLEVDIRDWEWGVVEKLYEWHFDIHGLIEKGLAIDINTIENGIQ